MVRPRIVLLVLILALVTHPPARAAGVMLVQAGAFWMGRDDGAREEAPMHRVYVRDFWIDRHKVTNAEFATFLNARGITSMDRQRRYDADDPDARIHLVPAVEQHAAWFPDAGHADHPAVEVSWFGARDYCEWRQRRLPTEAEWEKAARGDDKRPYPWGTAPPTPTLAVFGRAHNATDRGDARPDGAGPSRVEDLLGNLREWTSSTLRAYPYRADDGREPYAGIGRVVVRGASHDEPATALHVATRHSYERRSAAAGHHHVGFRCATSEDLGGY